MQKQIEKFFEQHPGVDEVHEALGVLFTDKSDAEKFLGGVHGQQVTTYTRPLKGSAGAQVPEPPVVPHVVTEEDLVNNPDLAAEGIEVGEVIGLLLEDVQEAAAEQKPKKGKKK